MIKASKIIVFKLIPYYLLLLFFSSCIESKTETMRDADPVLYRNDSIILFPGSNKMSGSLNTDLRFYIETNGNRPLCYTDSASNSLYTIIFGYALVSYDLSTGKEKKYHRIQSNKYDTNYKLSKYKNLIVYQNTSGVHFYTEELEDVGSLLDSLGNKSPFCRNRIVDYTYRIENDTLVMTVYYDHSDMDKKRDSIICAFLFNSHQLKLLTELKSCNNENDLMYYKSGSNAFLDTHYISIMKTARSPLDFFLLEHADSIDNIKNNKLPAFIFEPNFDMEWVGYWPTFHNPISLRKMIIEKVTDCGNLKKIADSKNSNLDVKPIDVKSNNDLVNYLPFNDQTTRSLIHARMKALNCK